MAVEVTTENFQEKVLNSDKPVLIDFWAEWCGPCKQVAPIMDELAQEYDGKAVIAKLNIDEAGEVASQLGITSIPTMVVFKNGEPVEAQVGVAPKSKLAQMLDKHL